jgi:hypothetical protein
MSAAYLVEGEEASDGEVLGESLSQCNFIHHKSLMTWDETWAFTAESRWLAVWALAWAYVCILSYVQTKDWMSEDLKLGSIKWVFSVCQEVTFAYCKYILSCKIWGVHRGDYEECGLLGYKNPVRTSQETHYVPTIESSQLMLCKIWGFHRGDYEEWCLLGCYAMWLL